MTVADRRFGKTWRIIHDSSRHDMKADSAEEARFLLACEGRTVVATVEYPEYDCVIMWTNDFSNDRLYVQETDGKWIVAWSWHYRIASFPDRDSAFEWVRNSFDGEKTFRKTSDAEYVVMFGRKA